MMAKYCQDRGIEPWTSCVSLTGAICRNGGETAIRIVCNALAQLAYGHGGMVQMFANHLDGTWSDHETQWAVGAATRAFERHVKNPIASVCAGIDTLLAHLCRYVASTGDDRFQHHQWYGLCLDRWTLRSRNAPGW